MEIRRGQIWWADLGMPEHKRVLIVSNDQRNRALGSVVALYVTSNADKPELPSIARFEPGELGESHSLVCADDPWVIPNHDLKGFVTAATPGQMLRVNQALKAALGLH